MTREWEGNREPQRKLSSPKEKIKRSKTKHRYNPLFGGVYEFAVGTMELAIKNRIYSSVQMSYLVTNQTIRPLRLYTLRFLIIEKVDLCNHLLQQIEVGTPMSTRQN